MRPTEYVLIYTTFTCVLLGGICIFMYGFLLPKEYTVEEKDTLEADLKVNKRIKEARRGEDLVSIRMELKEEIANPKTTGHFKNKVFEGKEKMSPPAALTNITGYNWLVSINMYRYVDLPASLEFFCAGTIITLDKMMTGDSCIKEHFTKEDLKKAVIRSGSAYFFTGGMTHSVTRIFDNPLLRKPYKQIIILEVHPHFEKHTRKPKLVKAPSVHREKVRKGRFIVVGWGGEQDQTEQIYKNEPFIITEWFSESRATCKDTICHRTPETTPICCNEAIVTNDLTNIHGPVSGRVLIYDRPDTPQLIAIELIHLFKGRDTNENDLTYFVDLGDKNFLAWIESLIPEILINVNETVTVGANKLILYSQWKTSHYYNDMKYFATYNPLKKYFLEGED